MYSSEIDTFNWVDLQREDLPQNSPVHSSNAVSDQDERTQFRDERKRERPQQWQRQWSTGQWRPVVTEPDEGLVDHWPDQWGAQIHDRGDLWI